MKYAFFPGCSFKGAAGYEESAKSVCSMLGLDLVEIDDWNCCGATTYWSINEVKAHLLPARIMALALRQGFKEIVTACNACYSTLRKAHEKLRHSGEMLEKVNAALSVEGLEFKPGLRIRHLLEVIANDCGEGRIKRLVKADLSDLGIAPYYGCQLTRPWSDIDDPHRPLLLDRIIKAAGAKPLENYSARTECCGAAQMVAHRDLCIPLNKRILKEAKNKAADAICTICPLCQLNLDSAQIDQEMQGIPVIFFTQLLGLSFGIPKSRLELNKLITPFKAAV